MQIAIVALLVGLVVILVALRRDDRGSFAIELVLELLQLFLFW